jgi:competence protein ComEC
MSRPLAWITLFFCAGIVFAKFIAINFWLVFALAAIALLLGTILINKKIAFPIILLTLSILSGMLIFRNSQILPKCHISNFIFYKSNSPYTVKGVIESPPETKNDLTTFVFNAKELYLGDLSYLCCGKILVRLKCKRSLSYGQNLILKGSLFMVPSLQQSGRNYSNYLKEQGIYCIMRVDTENMTFALNKNRGFSVKRFAFWLKEKIEGIISRYVPDIPASVLGAMILGEQRNVPRIIYNSMIKTGTVHILVVSGFNVGIVVFIVTLFLKLTRIPRRARFIIAIPCLIIYCLLTGASTPVVRATVMGIFFLVAYLFKREPDIYNSLSLAALFILLINPRQLFNIGFQLSFVSVISIVYLYPRLKALIHLDSVKIKSLKFLAEGCLVSLSAWLGTCGFIAYYFQFFSPVTIFANLFVVPLATLITLCGFSLIFASLAIPFLAPYFALSSELAVTLLVKLNLFLSSLPFASFSFS